MFYFFELRLIRTFTNSNKMSGPLRVRISGCVCISIKPKEILNKETNNSLSKSSNLLLNIFGSEKIIFEFDKARKNLKSNVSTVTKSIYGEILTKLEVKVELKNDEVRKQLKEVELENLKKSSHLNTLPTNQNDQESYDRLLKQLKIHKNHKKTII